MQYMPYHNKYVQPCFNMALKLFAVLANIAALCTIVGAVLEFGFHLSEELIDELNLVYFWTWMMFLIERIGHLLLTKRGQRRSAYSFMGWTINGLLVLTLIPIIIEFFDLGDSIGFMRILGNKMFHLPILFLIATIELSDSIITSLGRKSNPALMMAVSFLFIIMVGSGMLPMPRCIQPGVHLSWIVHLYENFRLKIIAIKKSEKVLNFTGIEYNSSIVVNTTEDDLTMEAGDVLVCYGKESDFRKLCRSL